MAAVPLQYPSTDDYEQSQAGSGPVELKPLRRLPPTFKIDTSVTGFGGQGYGKFVVVTNLVPTDWPTGSTGWIITQTIENGVAEREPVKAKTADKLAYIYKLDKSQSTRRIALDLIVDFLDDWMNEGRFDKCGLMLLEANPNELSDSAIVTFLGITKAARSHPLLFGREEFFRRAHAVVSQRMNSEEAADKLLNRYF